MKHPRLMSVGLYRPAATLGRSRTVHRHPALYGKNPLNRQTDIPCTINALDDDRIEVIFDEPVAAVTPGQSAVFYSGEVCLGGGINRVSDCR